jgi:uncharacterized damage-inducible protein DinB
MTNVWSDLCNVGADLKPRAYTDIYSGPRLSAPMPNLQPEQATLALHVALPAIQREHQTTRSVIEAIPLDNGDYRPEPVAKTALELAWHIVAAEHRFYSAVAAGEFDFTPRHRPEDVKNSADIGKFYGESFAKDMEALKRLSGEQLAKVIDFRGMIQLPAVGFLDLGLRHSIHHRGQLSVYLRPAGGKVPAIYGESYDSAEAKKSAGTA